MLASRPGLRPDSHARPRVSALGSAARYLRGIGRVVLVSFVLTAAAGAAGVAAPAASAATPKPVLKVSGNDRDLACTVRCQQLRAGHDSQPTTTRNTTYQTVSGTSFKPAAVPGQAVNYGLRANVSGAPWAAEVTINWPVPLRPSQY